MERVQDDRSHRGVSGEMPGLRREGGESAAAAEPGAVQLALRGRGGSSLRECIRAASGAALNRFCKKSSVL